MELLWFLLVAVVTIKASIPKSIVDNNSDKAVNQNTVSKVLRPYPHGIAIRRNSSILPDMPDRREKMVVNKPTMKNENQTTKTEKNKNRLMKNLPIKYINYNVNAKLPSEITTRRSLMQIRKFTVRPHDIYRESAPEKYIWNNYRKKSPNPRKPTSETNITEINNKSRNEEENSEQKFLNFKNVDNSINENDTDELGKEEQKNTYIAAGSQKSNTIVLFLHENNTKYLNVDPEQKTSRRTDEIKSDLENKTPDDIINIQNGIITDGKDESINSDTLLIKSEPKANSYDQEKTNLSENIINNGVKKSDVPFVGTNIILTSPASTVGGIDMPTHSDLDFVVT